MCDSYANFEITFMLSLMIFKSYEGRISYKNITVPRLSSEKSQRWTLHSLVYVICWSIAIRCDILLHLGKVTKVDQLHLDDRCPQNKLSEAVV